MYPPAAPQSAVLCPGIGEWKCLSPQCGHVTDHSGPRLVRPARRLGGTSAARTTGGLRALLMPAAHADAGLSRLGPPLWPCAQLWAVRAAFTYQAPGKAPQRLRPRWTLVDAPWAFAGGPAGGHVQAAVAART
jgi:hypothetical protein